jgi:hypothetical protein
MEEELGDERQLNLFDGERVEQEQQPPPDGPITVGIDGGYVRAAHKEGFFEVIAGRNVVAFRRAADDEAPESKCFGYVQTYDKKPRRRLYELMKSQGLQDNQQVVFMSDGGEDVRRVQMYLHPSSEHWIDIRNFARRRRPQPDPRPCAALLATGAGSAEDSRRVATVPDRV